jgi:hypothetical protein
MGYHDLHRYVYRTEENPRFIGRTRTAGSVRYDNGRIITRGPEREFVEQRGNIRIPRTEMVDVRDRGRAGTARDGSGERIEVYRPRIDATSRVMTGTRPDRVRVDDHPMGLDPRGTDIRRSEDAGQPRESVVPRTDGRKIEERRPAVRAPEPNIIRERPMIRQNTPDRNVNRPVLRPDRAVRTPDRPANEIRPSRPERRPEGRIGQNFTTPPSRTWSPPQRTFTPGSGGKSPGGRTEAPKSERGGGGGRGSRR